jgi:hypothetical protein
MGPLPKKYSSKARLYYRRGSYNVVEALVRTL